MSDSLTRRPKVLPSELQLVNCARSGPKDKVSSLPARLCARRRRAVGVLDLFPVLRIERFAIAEHRLRWKVIELYEFVDERILIRKVMRQAVSGFPAFEDRHAFLS